MDRPNSLNQVRRVRLRGDVPQGARAGQGCRVDRLGLGREDDERDFGVWGVGSSDGVELVKTLRGGVD
jgi:hypothetical protein